MRTEADIELALDAGGAPVLDGGKDEDTDGTIVVAESVATLELTGGGGGTTVETPVDVLLLDAAGSELGGTSDEISVVEVAPLPDVGAEIVTDDTINEDEGEISVESVETATELEMVVTAVVVPVPAAGEDDELSPRVVPVGTETVGKPGGSSDVAAVVLEFVYGTDEDAGDTGAEVPLIAELLAPEPPADELLSDATGAVHVTGRVDPELAAEEDPLPSVPEVNALEDRAVGVPGAEILGLGVVDGASPVGGTLVELPSAKEEDGPVGPLLPDRADDELLRPGTTGVDDSGGGRLVLPDAVGAEPVGIGTTGVSTKDDVETASLDRADDVKATLGSEEATVGVSNGAELEFVNDAEDGIGAEDETVATDDELLADAGTLEFADIEEEEAEDATTELEFVGAGSDVDEGVGRVVLKVEFGPGGRHTPGTTAPLRHLQDEEQELSGVPFRDPSSHSSSRLASHTPSPQPSGVAPLTMI